MSSLSGTDFSAIVALLALRDVIDLDLLANLAGDSIDDLLGNSDIQQIDTCYFTLNNNSKEKDDIHITKSLGKTTTRTKNISPAGNLLPTHYFAGAEASVLIEDCGTSSTESEDWGECLAEFSGESLSPVQMSMDGSNSDDSIFDEYIYGPLEDWITNSTANHDLEVQSVIGIDEPFLGNSILSEAVNSSESWMDWVEWSKLLDGQLANQKRLKKPENEGRRKANEGAKTGRYRSTRAAAGISRKKNRKYSWKVHKTVDSIPKLRVYYKSSKGL
ncbi:hypothetical protein IFR05_015022 [Cadophora sp. M221]|nr:hypothetical protein IFR05_015022 [Cadophora sp. M221]